MKWDELVVVYFELGFKRKEILCNKPQGKLTGYILDKFWINKEKFTRAGFEPATSGLTCRRSTN